MQRSLWLCPVWWSAAILSLPTVATSTAQEAKRAAEQQAPAAANTLTEKELYKALLHSVAWIRTGGPANDPGASMGTGFVVDIDRKLVVTNEHVVKGHSERGYDEMIVHFPEFDANERPIVEPSHYLNQPRSLRGEVIHRDVGRDLALIKLPSLPTSVKAIQLAADLPEPGDKLVSIAGLPEGSEGLWIMSVGNVRQSYRRSHANGAVAGVVESDMPTNRGNSGGPIVNDRNELVAVCEGAQNNARLVSLFIDVNEVREFLEICEPLIEPQSAQAWYDRGSFRHNVRRWELALKDYGQALKLDPSLTLAAVNRGWVFITLKDYATGEVEFSSVLKRDAENGSAYEGRAVCRRELGRIDEALADFTEAIRREPDDSHLYFRRAIAFRHKNDLKSALDDLNRCIALDPHDAGNFGARGQVHRLLKQYHESVADFESAAKLEPRNALWWYESARVFTDQNNYPAAIGLLTVAITIQGDDPSFYNDRGICLQNLERYAEALSDFQAAMKLQPKNAKYAEQCGNSLWYLNRVREAWDFYNQSVILDPSRPSAWRSRGDCYKHLGDLTAAQRDYAQAARLERK